MIAPSQTAAPGRRRKAMMRLITQICVISDMCVYPVTMPTDAEITFADHMGRFYARRFSFPPMVGRLLGYLAVCDPPNPTIGELAEALLASRSAIAGAVKVLETIHVVQRSRVAGERMDRVRIDLTSQQSMGMDVSEYEEMRELAREGLEVLSDAPLERRAALLEMSAFAEFLVEQMPKLRQEWEARREALVASGDLPEERPGQRRHP
jgi:DNA-binding MarR family transcriptional regulator